MSSLKHLSGVAHSIGHHAQSSVSWLHPHIGRVCRLGGVAQASVELLDKHPYPSGVPRSEPLALALAALRERFLALLAKHGLLEEDVQSAILTFSFRATGDDYNCAVDCAIRSRTGRTYSHFIDFI